MNCPYLGRHFLRMRRGAAIKELSQNNQTLSIGHFHSTPTLINLHMDYKWKYYPSDKMSERAQMELSPYKTNFPFKWGQDRYYETKFANVMGHTYPFSELIRV